MPLDPKYSNLPYIANDQPDVYESGDLPESDQANQEAEQHADKDVQSVKIDHAAASAKFRGKSLNADDTDFTDSVRAGRRAGYSLRQRELEIVADGESESPLQKFQRLQAELHSLASAVEEAKTMSMSEHQTATPEQLSALVRGLQDEVAGLHLESVLGPDASDLPLFDPESCLEKRLRGELEKLSKQSGAAGVGGSGGGKSGEALVYEIYASAAAGAANATATADLESRLARLEAAVGQQPLKPPALAADLAGKSLWDATHRMAAKLSLLDATVLDQIDSRLAALNHRLQQVTSDKREVLGDADTAARVSELYQLVKKWDTSADCIHQIVSRLQSLKELHQQAMQFSGALSLIDQSQRGTASQLASAQSLLSGLEQRVAEDLSTVESNAKCLQDRLKAIGK